MILKKYVFNLFTLRYVAVAPLWLLAATPLRAQQVAALKIAPGVVVAARRGQPSQTVRVRVRNAAAFRQWASQTLPQLPIAPAATADAGAVLLLKNVTPTQLKELVASPLVEFVDVPNRTAHDERLLNQADLTVNSLLAAQQRYPALTGQGLTVSIKENPLDPTDLDFRGRLLNTPPGTVIESAHASIMATLIAGGGNSGPGGRGAAPQAAIASSSYTNLLPDANTELTQRGVSVQNHSYGTGIENYYGLEALGYDQQTQQLPTLLHVFSSGNSGTAVSPTGRYQGLVGVANLTGQFKMSKNSVSVGATDALGQVAPLSSRGPAYDGRVKPELVAYGDAGSSDASALVSGTALLVQQAYRDAHSGVLPPAALVRAALLNSADDVGQPSVDFTSGYGQLNALGAVRTVANSHYQLGELSQGQEQVFTLTVPANTPQLKITLTWTDPAAAANAAQALINDLDLTLRGPDGATAWLPWTLSAYPHPDSLSLPARRRADHLNNAEQITLSQPPAGVYQVRVRGYQVPSGPQAFSVAYQISSPDFEWLAPASNRNVRPGQATQLRWNWAGPAQPAGFEYRPLGGGGWRSIAVAVDLTQHTLTWTAPDTTTLTQLRCVVAGGKTYLSDTLILARPLPLHVGYNCAAEGLITWPSTPGASQYQVYRLGATAPEPYRLVTDTLLVLTPPLAAGPYYAVAPVLGGRLAERGATNNIAQVGGVGCYIQSFLPQQPVADTARLVLVLGSLYHLQTIQLQRLGPNGFATIQTLNPVGRLRTVFTDLTAMPGLNQYRIQGLDAAGRTFYSEIETVQLVRSGELLVFPVPVAAGAVLLVGGPPGQALHMRLYDPLGRLVREATGIGALNQLPTAGLLPGTYVLRAQPEAGPAVARRVVVL
ncbi:MAG: S8 family serine peptidase [Janthinobacterium lividum]